MYRVLIVDDEPVIRKGISAFIDWESEGLIAEDQYANGAEALSALTTGSYDILITDIKMPLMNGIELMKKAQSVCPSLKVILISNYSDFKYVKEGLKLGAVDYLLKLTLKKEDLLAVLRKCILMLEEERKKEAELSTYQQGAAYLERKILEQEVKRLIVNDSISYNPNNLQPHWLKRSYACIYLMPDGPENLRETHGDLYIQFLLEEWQKRFYEWTDEGVALLIGESSLFLLMPDLEGNAVQKILKWKQDAEREWKISTSAGFALEHGIDRILTGYINSLSACGRRFFEGLGGLYTIDRAKTEMNEQSHFDWTPFFDMIRNGDPTSLALKFALKRWNTASLSPEKVKEEACGLLSGVHHLYPSKDSVLNKQQNELCKVETIEEMMNILSNKLYEIRTPFIPKAGEDYDEQLIAKVLSYMAAHFRENLTLQNMADVIHLSKSYFSLYFKKQTGRNYVDYLIDLRLREAKRLLAETDKRIYDVAANSGFKDVKYFSKVFKKTTGFTPIEYRNKYQAARPSIEQL